MKKTEQKFLKFISDKNLISKNDKVLIAFSGGPDSVFLFHLLIKYRRKFKIDLGAVHINHKLRGKDSDGDESFCKEFCDRFSIPIYLIRRDVKKYAKKKKMSLEEAGREIRYSEFVKLARANKYTKIATGHNCDDNAETVFLNLIKGTGIKGLAGIPVQRENIIRPMLILTKNEILDYLNKNKTQFRTDASNKESEFDRNYIRNEIFPLIRNKLNSSFEEKLLNTSFLIRSFSKQIDKIIITGADEVSEYKNGKLLISIPVFKKYDKEISGDIFKRSIESSFEVSLSFNNLKDLFSLLSGQTGDKINLTNNIIALRERNEILVFKKGKVKNYHEMEIKCGETVKLFSKKLSIIKGIKKPLEFSSNRKREFISGDMVNEKFSFRKWKPGDRFYPIGMKGTKKISDFLNEQKISSFDKENQLVLTNNGKIVWVVGLRLDDRFKVTNKTNRIFELCLK